MDAGTECDMAVSLAVDEDTVHLPIEAIAKARLVLTDELIAAAQEASGV